MKPIEQQVEEVLERVPNLGEVVVDVGGDSDTVDVKEILEDHLTLALQERDRIAREEERERIAEKLREAYMGDCEGEDTYIALAARIAMFINHLKK